MRLGIDLGGTKIEAVLMDAQGDLLHRERVPTPSHSYEAILETIGQLVCKLERAFAVSANIGIGTPGSLSAETGLMRNSNTHCLNGRSLQRDLEKVLGRELRLANDANCFALSEATDGAAEGAESVFGVILGTGVGGGLVFRNQLLSGVNGIAGEWGHNRLSETDEQRLCYCGRRDCIETHLCGAGLLQTYRQFGGTLTSVPELVAAAERGDGVSCRSLEHYCHDLARALAQVINIFDPEVIVLGGGLSNIPCLYQRVPELWMHWVFSDHCRTQLRANRFGDSSGVRGAARLWP